MNPIKIEPRVAEFSAEEIPLEEITAFYHLENAAVPSHRPYTWSMSVATMDGRISFLEAGAMAGDSIALSGVTGSGSGSDWRLLNAGWTYADAVLGTGQILRVEPATKWIPHHADLLAFRKEVLRKRDPYPMNIVLTGTGEIDLNHPILNDPSFRTIIITNEKAGEKLKILADQAAGENLFPFRDGNTELKILGREKDLDYGNLVRFLRRDLGIEHLDLTAGGTVIAAFAREKLIDECRITYAGQFCGLFNKTGGRRPGLFDPREGAAFSAGNSPLVRYAGIRLYGNHHLFLRGNLQYRH